MSKFKKVYNKTKDKNIPCHAVYVGRPTQYGNPFPSVKHKRDTSGILNYGMTRQRSVQLFSEYAHRRLVCEPTWLDELRGKPLICFCKPKACHGDILYFLANKMPIKEQRQIRRSEKYVIYYCSNYVIPENVFEYRLPHYAQEWYEVRCPKKGVILFSSPYYIDIASWEYRHNNRKDVYNAP